jgi:hypothetical protein
VTPRVASCGRGPPRRVILAYQQGRLLLWLADPSSFSLLDLAAVLAGSPHTPPRGLAVAPFVARNALTKEARLRKGAPSSQ